MSIGPNRGDLKDSYDCFWVRSHRSQRQMSKLPTQEAPGLHLSGLENQFANPRYSSRLAPQSDQVNLPPYFDWSLLTFGADVGVYLMANRPTGNVGRDCGEGSLQGRFGCFLALIAEEAIHGRCWEVRDDGPTMPNRVISRFAQLNYGLARHKKDRT